MLNPLSTLLFLVFTPITLTFLFPVTNKPPEDKTPGETRTEVVETPIAPAPTQLEETPVGPAPEKVEETPVRPAPEKVEETPVGPALLTAPTKVETQDNNSLVSETQDNSLVSETQDNNLVETLRMNFTPIQLQSLRRLFAMSAQDRLAVLDGAAAAQTQNHLQNQLMRSNSLDNLNSAFSTPPRATFTSNIGAGTQTVCTDSNSVHSVHSVHSEGASKTGASTSSKRVHHKDAVANLAAYLSKNYFASCKVWGRIYTTKNRIHSKRLQGIIDQIKGQLKDDQQRTLKDHRKMVEKSLKKKINAARNYRTKLMARNGKQIAEAPLSHTIDLTRSDDEDDDEDDDVSNNTTVDKKQKTENENENNKGSVNSNKDGNDNKGSVNNNGSTETRAELAKNFKNKLQQIRESRRGKRRTANKDDKPPPPPTGSRRSKRQRQRKSQRKTSTSEDNSTGSKRQRKTSTSEDNSTGKKRQRKTSVRKNTTRSNTNKKDKDNTSKDTTKGKDNTSTSKGTTEGKDNTNTSKGTTTRSSSNTITRCNWRTTRSKSNTTYNGRPQKHIITSEGSPRPRTRRTRSNSNRSPCKLLAIGKGSRVTGKWKGPECKGDWYDGTVVTLCKEDETAHVKYDDGTEDENLKWTDLRLI